jgi:hypothetical protein
MARLIWADDFRYGAASFTALAGASRPYVHENNGYSVNASRQAAPGGGTNPAIVLWSRSAAEVDITCTQVGSPAGNNAGIWLRSSGATVYVRVILDTNAGGTVYLQKRSGGAETTIASATAVGTTYPKTIRVAVKNNEYRVWVDGTLRITATDSVNSSERAQRHGLGANATSAAQDNLAIYGLDGRQWYRCRQPHQHHHQRGR